MVNRDALLNELRLVLVRFSHGELPSTKILDAMLAITANVDETWSREDMLDLIGAMIFTPEQADAMVLARV